MMRFDHRALRDALGHFATGVAVVTCESSTDAPVAMTISSFNTVSLDPPLVLFSIAREARSLPELLQAEVFGISILANGQQSLSNRFARSDCNDKWQDMAPAAGQSGCPLIHPSLARFECTTHAVHDGGDHVIIVGRVLAFAHEMQGEPLVFFRGRYHAIATGPETVSGEYA